MREGISFYFHILGILSVLLSRHSQKEEYVFEFESWDDPEYLQNFSYPLAISNQASEPLGAGIIKLVNVEYWTFQIGVNIGMYCLAVIQSFIDSVRRGLFLMLISPGIICSSTRRPNSHSDAIRQ